MNVMVVLSVPSGMRTVVDDITSLCDRSGTSAVALATGVAALPVAVASAGASWAKARAGATIPEIRRVTARSSPNTCGRLCVVGPAEVRRWAVEGLGGKMISPLFHGTYIIVGWLKTRAPAIPIGAGTDGATILALESARPS